MVRNGTVVTATDTYASDIGIEGGRIAAIAQALPIGSDADLVVFDADEEQVISVKTHHMRVDYSMFEGIRIKGVPKTVLSRGRPIIENGAFVGKAGSGEFIRRQRYSGI